MNQPKFVSIPFLIPHTSISLSRMNRYIYSLFLMSYSGCLGLCHHCAILSRAISSAKLPFVSSGMLSLSRARIFANSSDKNYPGNVDLSQARSRSTMASRTDDTSKYGGSGRDRGRERQRKRVQLLPTPTRADRKRAKKNKGSTTSQTRPFDYSRHEAAPRRQRHLDNPPHSSPRLPTPSPSPRPAGTALSSYLAARPIRFHLGSKNTRALPAARRPAYFTRTDRVSPVAKTSDFVPHRE